VAHWTLDALADAAQAQGIMVGRSQVRRVLLAEGCAGARSAPGAATATPRMPEAGARLEGLVADPSIMPSIPVATTNLPTITTAERVTA
jgi:hypothetical protein